MQIIVKGIGRNETDTIETVRKNRMFCNEALVNFLNEPPYGRQNQTNRPYMFRKITAINHNIIFD